MEPVRIFYQCSVFLKLFIKDDTLGSNPSLFRANYHSNDFNCHSLVETKPIGCVLIRLEELTEKRDGGDVC